jgi:hypothetical protein
VNSSLRESKLQTPLADILHDLISGANYQFLNFDRTIDDVLFQEVLVDVSGGSWN